MPFQKPVEWLDPPTSPQVPTPSSSDPDAVNPRPGVLVQARAHSTVEQSVSLQVSEVALPSHESPSHIQNDNDDAGHDDDDPDDGGDSNDKVVPEGVPMCEDHDEDGKVTTYLLEIILLSKYYLV